MLPSTTTTTTTTTAPTAPTRRRPHVPSKSALRILYQLAYISSGTVLGIATLCAEERRRRTKVLQRIADNARLIRQSPRYYAAGAGVSVAQERDGEEVGGFEQRVEVGEEATRGPELPSVVEREYERVGRIEYKKVRRRDERGGVGWGLLETGEAVETKRRGAGEGFGYWSLKGEDYKPHGRYPMERLSSRWIDSEGASVEKQVLAVRNRIQHSYSTSGDDESVLARGATKDQTVEEGSRETSTSVLPYLTGSLWEPLHPLQHIDTSTNCSRDGLISANADEIKRDVIRFFRRIKDTSGDRELEHDILIAGNLLRLAVKFGHSDDIKALLRWYLARPPNRQQVLDLEMVSRAIRSTNKNYKSIPYFEIIFASPAFAALKDNQRAMLVFRDDAAIANPEALPPHFQSALNGLPKELVDNYVMAKCHYLVLDDQWNRAMNVVLTYYDRMAMPGLVMNDLFAAALEQKSAWCAWRLLFWKQQRQPVTGPEWDRFIALCGRTESQKPLHEFIKLAFVGIEFSLSVPAINDLNTESYATLAKACITAGTDFNRKIFNEIYRRMPRERRASFMRTTSDSACKELHAVWNSTHNLKTTLDLAQHRMDSLKAGKGDLVPVRVTLVEILLRAGKIAPAQHLLSQLHVHGQLVGSLAALNFAKKKDWESLDRLLAILEQEGVVWSGAAPRSHCNQFLHLYASEHAAEDSLALTLRLSRKLGLRPNNATNTILLQMFVRNQRLDLMHVWYEHLREKSSEVQISPKTAVDVLKTYYIKHRPSHVLIMWFCRGLAKSAPQLVANKAGWVGLIKEAIAYDMRKARGRRVNWKREVAKQRLASLTRVEKTGTFPHPGYRMDDRIVYPPSPPRRPELISPSKTDGGVNAESRVPHSKPTLQPIAGSTVIHKLAVGYKPSKAIDYAEDDTEAYDGEAGVDDMLAQWDENRGSKAVDEGYYSPMSMKDGSDDGDHFSDDVNEMIRTSIDMSPSNLRDVKVSSALRQGPNRGFARRERDMILALSGFNYALVLSIYEQTLDAVGLPASPLALEIAVEASIRLHRGSLVHAEELMKSASDAGFDVSCAMGPLLIHRMYRTRALEHHGWGQLLETVTEYYRSNKENGWPVKHHVAVTAANVLTNRHRPEEGLKLLSHIANSEWAEEKALSIEAMTVYLKAYSAMCDIDGIKWVVDHVLNSDMHIDTIFLSSFKLSIRSIKTIRDEDVQADRKFVPLLAHLYEKCKVRHQKQMLEGKSFGKKLVRWLTHWANQDTVLVNTVPQGTADQGLRSLITASS